MDGLSAVLRGYNFNFGHCAQIFQTNSFIPALLTGTVDFNHFKSLSVTVILAARHKVS